MAGLTRAAAVTVGLALTFTRPLFTTQETLTWDDLYKDTAHLVVGGLLGAAAAAYFRSDRPGLWLGLGSLATAAEVVAWLTR